MNAKDFPHFIRRQLRLFFRIITKQGGVPKKGQRLDWNRIIHEKHAPIRVIYIIGMPRTGTTLIKNYFADGIPELMLHPYHWNYFEAWMASRHQSSGKIVIDKRTQNILKVPEIVANFGASCALVCIVRDPRDQLISLLNYPGHKNIPRDESFWETWVFQYSKFLSVCLNYFQYDRNYLIRYEDFVKYPQQAKSDFLDWLEINWTGKSFTRSYSTINTTYADAIRKQAGTLNSEEAWKLGRDTGLNEDYIYHSNDSIFTDSVGKWRQKLTTEESFLVEGYIDHPHTVRMMSLFGYFGELRPITNSIPGCHTFIPNKLINNEYNVN